MWKVTTHSESTPKLDEGLRDLILRNKDAGDKRVKEICK